MTSQRTDQIRVYVGTYTTRLPYVDGKSDGIQVYRLDTASGELTFVDKLAGVVNPSFLVIDAAGRHLYAVNETFEWQGEPGGGVSAFAIDPHSGALTPLNQQPSYGTGPCCLSIDRTGRFLLVANYAGGSVTIYPIRDDGQIGQRVEHIQHAGPGSLVVPDRQEAPHAHLILTDRANRFAFVPDLGLDRVMIYAFDERTGRLTPADRPWLETDPGAGPRHLTFHPNGRHAFLISELASTITTLRYRPETGSLEDIHTVSTLPGDFDRVSICSDVQVSPSGRFVYGGNRGHDSIAIFAFDEQTGQLTLVGHESTQGAVPRHFGIDPTGTFLLAANQDSDTVVTFRVDQQTGELSPTGHTARVATPVCILMAP